MTDWAGKVREAVDLSMEGVPVLFERLFALVLLNEDQEREEEVIHETSLEIASRISECLLARIEGLVRERLSAEKNEWIASVSSGIAGVLEEERRKE